MYVTTKYHNLAVVYTNKIIQDTATGRLQVKTVHMVK